MSLCCLFILRSIRRYSAASNPYPFHSPHPASAGQTSDYPPQNSQYNPNHPPPFQNFSASNHSHSPASSISDADADTLNYHYNYTPNPQFSASASNYPCNSQTRAAADASNYQHNPQYPTPGSNHQDSSQIPDAAVASYTQHNLPNSTPQSSNYNQSNPYLNTPTAANNSPFTSSADSFVPQRSHGYSSAEEAAAERRRRKRRLRIEPPLYALRPNPSPRPPVGNPEDPSKPRLPDSTNVLVGPRLNLHNRVQSLIRAGDLDAASYVARQAAYHVWSLRPTVFTCNAIIAAMGLAGRHSDAQALFQYFFRQFDIIPNVVSYNSLILSHCDSGQVDEALRVYNHMLEHAPFGPSSVTFRHLTKGLVDSGRIDEAVTMLREMLQKGQGADSLVFNNVILGFLNLGQLDKANELFDELRERCTVYDGVVSATFVDWFFKQGKPKEAMEAYRVLLSRNYTKVPATRNVILEMLLRHGRKKEAWDMFHVMLDEHTPPTFIAVNSDTVNMMVNECFKEGNIEEAVDVFKRCGKGVKSKPFQMDVPGFNNTMSRLCEVGMVDEAEKYFTQLMDKALSPDVNSFRTLIEAYSEADRVEDVLGKYLKMVEAGLRVIPSYANKWFRYLLEKGRALDCVPIISKMANREPKPDVKTYEIVMRGLVEGGYLDATLDLLREMAANGVGVSASLKEFVLGTFEGVGRREEIDSVLNKFPSHFVPKRSHFLPRGMPPPSAEQGGLNPAILGPTGSSFHS